MFRSIFFVIVAFLGALSHGDNKSSMPSTWEEFTLQHRSMKHLFGTFQMVFNKSFTNIEEEKLHFDQFASHVKTIFDWNDAKNAKIRTYTRQINRFSDLSVEERKLLILPKTMADVSFFFVISCFYLFFFFFLENSITSHFC
jgi:hypothetical protein